MTSAAVVVADLQQRVKDYDRTMWDPPRPATDAELEAAVAEAIGQAALAPKAWPRRDKPRLAAGRT